AFTRKFLDSSRRSNRRKGWRPCAEISRAWRRRTILLTFTCLDECARARSQRHHLGAHAVAHMERSGMIYMRKTEPHHATRPDVVWRPLCTHRIDAKIDTKN